MNQDADEFMDGKFDFDDFVRNARLGYAELCGRRETLEATITTANEELVNVRDQIEKLAKVLESSGIEAEENLARPRTSNVSLVTGQVIEEIFSNPQMQFVSESFLIDKVRMKLPDAKPKSINAALYRMMQAERLTRKGKRGSYSYTLRRSEIDALVTPTTPPELVTNDLRPGVTTEPNNYGRASDKGHDGYTG